jgi:hypothetical protein
MTLNDNSDTRKTTANVPVDLYHEARRRGAELGIYEWQEITITALRAWLAPSTPANMDDPRLARVVQFLSIPGNLDRMEQFLQAFLREP